MAHGGFHFSGRLLSALGLALALWWTDPAGAQVSAARALITAAIDNSALVSLPGNVRPEANAKNDRGRVPDALHLTHMQLLLRRPPEREAALRGYIEALHDRTSPEFHRWLNARQFGQRFGVAQHDLTVITHWLEQQGFTVNTVSPSTLIIDFSGTAGQVLSAFHCQIHFLAVGGSRHIANMSDPRIPAALAPAIVGVVSLNDFRPHPEFKSTSSYTFTNNGVTEEAVVPADLATIYSLAPLFAAGISGQSQTIVVIEDSDLYSTSDWTTFRSTFGLSTFTSGSVTQVNPSPASGPNNCTDPGTVAGNEAEAELDAEWASAAAPSAAILLASCKDTATTFGGLIALENLVDSSSPPAIVSISYGECEAESGATTNAAYNSIYQQAVALGTSIFVGAGDEGAAGCDAKQSVATHGIGVNGLASTPYDVAVGGTDFGDSYAGTTGTYWSSANSSVYGSAKSYIPEIPWNDSCANLLITAIEGYSVAYGAGGFCNSSIGKADFLTVVAGGGGPSMCATGAPSVNGVVGGTCAGYAKPSWQKLAGNPADNVRDLPDVALFAGNGVWGHYYVYCDSDLSDMGASCTGAPSSWSGAGGTSFAAPVMAGIQALVNEKTASLQGNPDFVYYTLAASQYASGLGCDSTTGNAESSGCVFNDVTLGDMDVNCQGSIDCYEPSGSNGVLSVQSTEYAIAYGTATGWDFATGIGSVNAFNLVMSWDSSDLSLSGGGSVTAGGLLSYAWTVGNSGPQTAAGIVLTTVLPSGLSLVPGSSSSGCSQVGQTVSCSIANLMAGSSAPVDVVINPGAAQAVDLSFSVSSSDPDLDPKNNVVTVDLSPPSETDGPIPLWANAAFGLALGLLALRRLQTRGNPGDRRPRV